MKKIPSLFVREFDSNHNRTITTQFTPGIDMRVLTEGIPTIKLDGSACAIIDGVLYRRYDAKHGKPVPKNAIPCCEPDPVTGHHPHWIPVDKNNPADKWYYKAYRNTDRPTDGTYEAIGPHFQNNPYKLPADVLARHGRDIIKDLPDCNFETIRDWLANNNQEGIVFWLDGEPVCKVKKRDFGMTWPDEDMWKRDHADGIFDGTNTNGNQP